MPRDAEPAQSERQIEEIHEPPYRYTVICWDDDCPESLDTYGGESILELAREHVEKHGHEMRIQAQSLVVIRPKGRA